MEELVLLLEARFFIEVINLAKPNSYISSIKQWNPVNKPFLSCKTIHAPVRGKRCMLCPFLMKVFSRIDNYHISNLFSTVRSSKACSCYTYPVGGPIKNHSLNGTRISNTLLPLYHLRVPPMHLPRRDVLGNSICVIP